MEDDLSSHESARIAPRHTADEMLQLLREYDMHYLSDKARLMETALDTLKKERDELRKENKQLKRSLRRLSERSPDLELGNVTKKRETTLPEEVESLLAWREGRDTWQETTLRSLLHPELGHNLTGQSSEPFLLSSRKPEDRDKRIVLGAPPATLPSRRDSARYANSQGNETKTAKEEHAPPTAGLLAQASGTPVSGAQVAGVPVSGTQANGGLSTGTTVRRVDPMIETKMARRSLRRVTRASASLPNGKIRDSDDEERREDERYSVEPVLENEREGVKENAEDGRLSDETESDDSSIVPSDHVREILARGPIFSKLNTKELQRICRGYLLAQTNGEGLSEKWIDRWREEGGWRCLLCGHRDTVLPGSHSCLWRNPSTYQCLYCGSKLKALAHAQKHWSRGSQCQKIRDMIIYDIRHFNPDDQKSVSDRGSESHKNRESVDSQRRRDIAGEGNKVTEIAKSDPLAEFNKRDSIPDSSKRDLMSDTSKRDLTFDTNKRDSMEDEMTTSTGKSKNSEILEHERGIPTDDHPSPSLHKLILPGDDD